MTTGPNGYGCQETNSMSLVSIREYARQTGVQHTTILKRVSSGKLTLVDGKVDPDRANAEWALKRDDSQIRKPAAAAAFTPPEPVARTGPSYADLLRAEKAIKIRQAEMSLRYREGALVDRAAVQRAVFERGRSERDALLNLPNRISANLAAKLGCDERILRTELEREIREHLTGRAAIDRPVQLPEALRR